MPTLNDKLDEIKRQKDLYILPQNLKKDVTVFGVTGTLEAGSGEDLEAEISAQEEYIAELEAIIDEKAQGESTPNIFLQTTEPTKKNGIWLQVADKEYEKVVAEDSVVEEPSWLPDGTVTDMTYGVDVGSAIAVGTDIYILGGESNGSRVCNYKFNTLTNTYTRMTDIPYDFMGCSAVAVNNDIYLFGLSNDKTYKYDISNNTYSSLTDMPYDFGFGSIVSVGNDVYIFGGQRRTNYCI